MPGKVSEDFAAALGKLRYQVDALEKSNKILENKIVELEKRLEAKDKDKAKDQRTRVLKAAFTADQDEIKELANRSDDLVEQEILRMFYDPVQPLQDLPAVVNPVLLANMQEAMADASMPELRVEEVTVKVPYTATEEYNRDVQKRSAAEIQAKVQQARQNYERNLALKRKNESNALATRSPIWQTDADF